jgi:hypothetical protein
VTRFVFFLRLLPHARIACAPCLRCASGSGKIGFLTCQFTKAACNVFDCVAGRGRVGHLLQRRFSTGGLASIRRRVQKGHPWHKNPHCVVCGFD